MSVFARCLSVSYDPVRRECRLSRYDQTGSRIVYDPEHDYYENLIGEQSDNKQKAPPFFYLSICLRCWNSVSLTLNHRFVFHQQNTNTIRFLLRNEV